MLSTDSRIELARTCEMRFHPISRSREATGHVIRDQVHSLDGRMSLKLSSINLRHSSFVPDGPSTLHPAGIAPPASQIENIPSSFTSTNQTAGEPPCRTCSDSFIFVLDPLAADG